MSDRRDLWRAGALWLALTAIGEYVVVTWPLMAPGLSAQAEEVDSAFNILMIYSVPVFAFVVTALVYSILRWRVKGDEPDGDGPPIEDDPRFSWGWFIVSTALAALIFFYPGLTGLLALAEEGDPDVVIELEAVQWHWNITFPEYGVTLDSATELVLPVDQVIKFEITSRDVIHSFWVPAFRMKQDAIPGQVTEVYVTPTEMGTFGTDSEMRLQCAELCGTGHARMYVPIRVVSTAEFEAWIAEMSGSASPGMDGMDMGDDQMDDEMDMGEDDGMDMEEEG
jgi:cytochrome c oxidase subunit 2